MSSKDKAGQDENSPEVVNKDHTPEDAARPDHHDADAQDGPGQQADNEPFSEVEDAEVMGDTSLDDQPRVDQDAPVDEAFPEMETGESQASAAPGAPDDTAREAAEPESREAAPADVHEDGRAETPPPPPTAPPPEGGKSGGGFFPALLGGLVAVGLGFGAAFYFGGDVLRGQQAAVQQALAAQDTRLSGLEERIETRLDELAQSLSAAEPGDDVGARLDALGEMLGERMGSVADRIEDVSATIGTIQTDLADLEAQVGGLDERMADMNDRLTAVERRPLTESSEAAQQAFSAYERDIAALRERLSEQEAANERMAAELDDRAAAAQAEMEAAAARAAEVQAQAEEQARVAAEQADARARNAAVREALASLYAALGNGTPFADTLAVLGEGADVPAPLQQSAEDGIASLPDLRSSFPALAREALDASIRETVADGMADRALAFLRAQSGVRSLAPREGDDPDAVLSRAEAALAEGDLTATLNELGQLPPAGQEVMSDWTARAEERRTVTEAADTLANTLLAN